MRSFFWTFWYEDAENWLESNRLLAWLPVFARTPSPQRYWTESASRSWRLTAPSALASSTLAYSLRSLEVGLKAWHKKCNYVFWENHKSTEEGQWVHRTGDFPHHSWLSCRYDVLQVWLLNSFWDWSFSYLDKFEFDFNSIQSININYLCLLGWIAIKKVYETDSIKFMAFLRLNWSR